jgi:hypothetical protein
MVAGRARAEGFDEEIRREGFEERNSKRGIERGVYHGKIVWSFLSALPQRR